jgi:hypothetical protein
MCTSLVRSGSFHFPHSLERVTNRPVTYFHNDSAGQYLKTHTQDYCKRASITVEQTATDAHQQNPRCERWDLTAMDEALYNYT